MTASADTASVPWLWQINQGILFTCRGGAVPVPPLRDCPVALGELKYQEDYLTYVYVYSMYSTHRTAAVTLEGEGIERFQETDPVAADQMLRPTPGPHL